MAFEGADLFLGKGAEAAEVSGIVWEVRLVFLAVKDFTGTRDLEAIALEALREDFVVLAGLSAREGWAEEVDAGGFG